MFGQIQFLICSPEFFNLLWMLLYKLYSNYLPFQEFIFAGEHSNNVYTESSFMSARQRAYSPATCVWNFAVLKIGKVYFLTIVVTWFQMHYLKGCKLPHEIRNTLDKLSTPISIVTKASQVKLSTWLVAAKHQYIEWIFFLGF